MIIAWQSVDAFACNIGDSCISTHRYERTDLIAYMKSARKAEVPFRRATEKLAIVGSGAYRGFCATCADARREHHVPSRRLGADDRKQADIDVHSVVLKRHLAHDSIVVKAIHVENRCKIVTTVKTDPVVTDGATLSRRHPRFTP